MAASAISKDLEPAAHRFVSRLHLPENADEDVPCFWGAEPMKCTLSAPTICSNIVSTPSVEHTEYSLSTNGQHHLTGATLAIDLPSIAVAEAYRAVVRFSLMPYPGLSFIEKGVFLYGGEGVIQSFDRTTFFIHLNKKVSGERRQAMLRDLGAPLAEEWRERMAPTTLLVYPPFMFNDGLSSAFPLFKAGSTPLSLRFHFIKSWAELIRMQIREGDEWVDKEFAPSYFEFSSAILPTPRLWTHVRRSDEALINSALRGTTELWFRTYVADDYRVPGDNLTIPMSCRFPCTGIYLVTNVNPGRGSWTRVSSGDGKPPVISATIRYGSDDRQVELPACIMERATHIMTHSTIPIEEGINFLPYGENGEQFDFVSTTTYTTAKQAKLYVNLTHPGGDVVHLRLRYEVIRRLQFTPDGKMFMEEPSDV
jgi:hypothetical protein